MIIIGVTSYFQKSFRISYKNWRTIHAVLALLFILLATLHVLGTGKHINTSLFFTIVFIVSGGILLLLRTYLFNAQKNRNE
jgi:predicted ferric reductase